MVKVKKVESVSGVVVEEVKTAKGGKDAKLVLCVESDAEADESSQEVKTMQVVKQVKSGKVKKDFPKVTTKHIHTLQKRNTQVISFASLPSSSTTMIQSQLPLVAAQLKSWRDTEKYEENPLIEMLRHQMSMKRVIVLKDRSSGASTYVDLEELIEATDELAEGYKLMNEEESEE
jgi:hypothetical protein